jgi:hypothetical protein
MIEDKDHGSQESLLEMAQAPPAPTKVGIEESLMTSQLIKKE